MSTNCELDESLGFEVIGRLGSLFVGNRVRLESRWLSGTHSFVTLLITARN